MSDDLLVGETQDLSSNLFIDQVGQTLRVGDETIDDLITPNPTYNDLSVSYLFIENILGGTKRAREMLTSKTGAYFGNQKYVFRRPKETDDEFAYRVSKLTMTQYFGNTVEQGSGILNRKPTVLNFPDDKEDEDVVSFFEDVDGNGTSADDLNRKITDEVLTYGKAGILTDWTSPESIEGRDEVSIADLEESGKRPVLRFVTAKSIINWKYGNIDGVKKLLWITLKEEKRENSEEIVYRIFYHGGAWNKVTILDDGSRIVEDGISSFTEIPLQMVYAKEPKKDQDIEPIFIDMAYHQVDEMELFTDLKVGGSYSCYTSFFISGANSDDLGGDLGFGPNKLMTAEPPDAKMSQVATNQGGLETAMKIIEQIIGRIIKSGLQLMSDGVSNMTAREVEVNRETSLSKLVYISKSLQSAWDNTVDTLYTMAEWGEENQVRVQVNDDVSSNVIDSQLFNVLKGFWIDKGLSLDTLWEILKRGEVLPSSFNPEDEKGRIDSEVQSSLEMGDIE